MVPNLCGFPETYRFSIGPCDWTFNLHGAQLYRGFSLQTPKREKVKDHALRNKMSDNILQTCHVTRVFCIKDILYMAPNGSYCSWNKHCFLTSKKRDSNSKRTSSCPDISTMLPTLLNKRHSLHGAQLMGFLKPTDFQLVHVIELSIYMAPNSIRAFLFKHQREKVKDPKAMWINFKLISKWRPTL